MNELRLDLELWLPRAPAEIFPFFAEAQNLQTLTPRWLDFQVLTPVPWR